MIIVIYLAYHGVRGNAAEQSHLLACRPSGQCAMPAHTRSDRVEDGKGRSSRGGVNLRDVASTDASRIRPGLVYRSSERFKYACCATVLQLCTASLARRNRQYVQRLSSERRRFGPGSR